MTSTIAPKRNTITTATTTPDTGMTMTDGTVGDVSEMSIDTGAPAATFEGAAPSSSKKPTAFNPPPTPRLVSGDVEGNTDKIKGYNEQRAQYLERYQDGAENEAVTDEMMRRIGPPVSYDNGVNALPVKERAQYDELTAPELVNAPGVYTALTDRDLREKGIATKTEFKGTFVEGQLTYKGNGARGGRELRTDGEEKIEHQAGMGLAGEHGGVTAWVDPTNLGGEKSLELNASNGAAFGGIEVSNKGKLTLEGGPMVELPGEIEGKLGGHVAIAGNEVELGEVLSAGALGFEGTVRAGVTMEVADPFLGTRVNLSKKGFFEDQAHVKAMISGGGR